MKRLSVIFILFFLLGSNADALFYKGAEGDEVRELQQGLYRAGYYGGVKASGLSKRDLGRQPEL